MHAAERIGRYYLDHALAVYDLMGQSHPALDDAREVLDWITKHCNKTGRDTFTRRDALRGLHGRVRFATATDLEPALDLLTDHGHIRPQATQKTPRAAAPSVYEVHPRSSRPQGRTDDPRFAVLSVLSVLSGHLAWRSEGVLSVLSVLSGHLATSKEPLA